MRDGTLWELGFQGTSAAELDFERPAGADRSEGKDQGGCY